MTITYCAPSPAVIRSVAERMDPDNVEEMRVSTGMTPVDALRSSVYDSCYARAACWDGKPQVIFGVAPYKPDPRMGVIWLLGTDAMRKSPRAFLKECRKQLHDVAKRFDVVFNVVPLSYVRAHRWLIWLGFQPIHSHTVKGETYIEFALTTKESP